MFDARIRTYIFLILTRKITINIHVSASPNSTVFNPDDNVTTSAYQTTCRGCSIGHVENIAQSDIKVRAQTPLRAQQTSIWTYTFMMEIVNRNLFKVSIISISILHNNVFYLNTTVITDTLLISTISIPCPKTIDVNSGLIEIKHLYTSWSSMTDDEYCTL